MTDDYNSNESNTPVTCILVTFTIKQQIFVVKTLDHFKIPFKINTNVFKKQNVVVKTIFLNLPIRYSLKTTKW